MQVVAIGILAMLAILLIVRFSFWLQWFLRELRYVKKEIARTTGHEQENWKRRKKRLWLSIIPFVGY